MKTHIIQSNVAYQLNYQIKSLVKTMNYDNYYNIDYYNYLVREMIIWYHIYKLYILLSLDDYFIIAVGTYLCNGLILIK